MVINMKKEPSTTADTNKRAVQFASFDALSGFHKVLECQTRRKEPMPELSQSDEELLSRKINSLKKGDKIRIIYHNGEKPTSLIGHVKEIDRVFFKIKVEKNVIDLSKIIRIQLL